MRLGLLTRHLETRQLLGRASDHCELEVRAAFAGFDPTAPSLHVGNLLPILGLVHAGNLGVRPYALIGSATALVGDPTGRKSAKSALDAETIAENARAIRLQIQSLYSRARSLAKSCVHEDVTLVDNLDWFRDANLLHFLGTTGRAAKVSAMLSRNSVQTRLASEDGLTFCELAYQLMQGHDFLHLNRVFGVNLQIGGSDQWGNMITGLDLVQRMRNVSVGCVTLPLLENSAGVKMGKSAGNGLWLDRRMTSVYDFYQYFVSLSDGDAERFLPMLTMHDLRDIGVVLEEHRADPARHAAQQSLAHSLTSLIHGAEAADQARRLSETLFSVKDGNFAGIDAASILSETRFRRLSRREMPSDATIVSLLVKLFPELSKTQIKHFVHSGAVQLNYRKIADVAQPVRLEELPAQFLLNLGQTSFYLVSVEE